MKTTINPEIFRAYDIRGIYPKELDENAAKQIAKAFVKFLNPKEIVVGHDMRNSSLNLHKAFISGLIEMGVDVFDIGLSPTPMLYFAPPFLGASGAVMVTASHNPLEYGGLKFVDAKGQPIYQKNGLLEIKKLSFIEIESAKNLGKEKKINLENDYLKHLKKTNLRDNNLKVVIDTMHGAMGPLVKKYFGESPNIILLSNDPDPRIPGYKTPNPSLDKNRKNIETAIHKNKADLGIMFDGDGDRMIAVDSRGEYISPNFTIALIIKEALRNKKGAAIIGDVRASHIIKETVEKEGGKYFFTKAGNPFVKEEMRKRDAILGFETTGHIMFKESNYAEDTLRGVIYLLNALASTNKSPQAVFDRFKTTYYIAKEMNFFTKRDDILKKVEKHYQNGKISKLDGLTIEFPKYWFNIRKSNTEPLIRLSMEANSEDILEEKKKELTDFLLTNGCKLTDH